MFFFCHEKALEYYECDALLNKAEVLGERCLAKYSDFTDNIVSETVLKMDVCRYLEEYWPVDDEDFAKLHKLYRLVAYHRWSRWGFQILGKKKRRPLTPACVFQRFVDTSRRPTVVTHTLNTQKHLNGNRYIYIHKNSNVCFKHIEYKCECKILL